MASKAMKLARGLFTLVAAYLIFAFAMGLPIVNATTSTVGGTGLKAQGQSVNVIATTYGTPLCFSVSISTVNPNLILAADPLRAELWMVNSTTYKDPALTRNPIVYITTGTTTNLGASPSQSTLNTINGLPLYPCLNGTITGSGGCRLDQQNGVATWGAAIYGIAETTGAYVSGCYLRP